MLPFHGLQAPPRGGHYESWFLRANHPHRAQAVWIRYTLFRASSGRPALGEVWAIAFDGSCQQVVAVKEEQPLAECDFSRRHMAVRVGDNHLTSGQLSGDIRHDGDRLAWSLHYPTDRADTPLLLLPEGLYQRRLPKAKSLVSRPHIPLSGTLTVNGEDWQLDRWPGSENHNWGSQHTDRYAWGQVVGFDNAPSAFLECATAQVKLGPLHTPRLSIAVLQLDGQRYCFNQPAQAVQARSHYRPFVWSLNTANRKARLTVDMVTEANKVAALTYYNPPGGDKFCLNSKLARVRVTLSRKGKPDRVLHSAQGGAFEILTDTLPDGLPLRV